MNNTITTDLESSFRILVHELRNPLTNVNLANVCINDMIDGNSFDGINIKTFTSLIAKNVSKMEQMLKTLIDFNQDGQVELSHADVCDCIEEALLRAEDRIYLQHVKIKKQFLAEPLVPGDTEKLVIAFLNIIINALEAMEAKDNACLDITVYGLDGEIKVVIEDNGKGMQPDVAEKIFDSYYTSKPDGLGMGLSHTKKILEMHNATVSVKSEPDMGTTAVISFS